MKEKIVWSVSWKRNYIIDYIPKSAIEGRNKKEKAKEQYVNKMVYKTNSLSMNN